MSKAVLEDQSHVDETPAQTNVAQRTTDQLKMTEKDKETPDSPNHFKSVVGVQIYLNFLYKFGLSPFKYEKDAKVNGKCNLGFHKWRQIWFGVFYGLGIIISFLEIKDEILGFHKSKEAFRLVQIVFNSFVFWAQFRFIYFLMLEKSAIIEVVEAFTKFSSLFKGYDKQSSNRGKCLSVVMVTYLIYSIIMSILTSLATYKLSIWSMDYKLDDQSISTTFSFLCWSGTDEEMIIKKIANYSNTTKYVLGISAIVSNSFYSLQVRIFEGLLLFVVLDTYFHLKTFEVLLKRLPNFHTPDKIQEQNLNCWRVYRELLKLCKTTDNTFGIYFKLYHANSFLMLASWWSDLVETAQADEWTVDTASHIPILLAIYYIAKSSAAVNDTCRIWILNFGFQGNELCVDDVNYDRPTMLAELAKFPVGIGSGTFHLNNEFIYCFLGAVVTCFGIINRAPEDLSSSKSNHTVI